MSLVEPPHEALAQAVELIDQADGLLVTAGAGMGVDSGMPDFRGTAGFWQSYPALGQARIAFERIANPQAFRVDAALAWGFYGHRLAMYRRTQPHAGFALLRQWAQAMPHGEAVFTSNVDGQFQQAGFDAMRVHECHGSIHHLQCARPCHEGIWPADAFVPEVDEATCRLLNAPPACPRCGGLARPNILMFGDGDWLAARSDPQADRLGQWLDRVRRPVVIELGAGVHIPTVRHFSQHVVHARGGRLIRINPTDADVPTSRDVGLAMGALAGLRAIAARRGP